MVISTTGHVKTCKFTHVLTYTHLSDAGLFKVQMSRVLPQWLQLPWFPIRDYTNTWDGCLSYDHANLKMLCWAIWQPLRLTLTLSVAFTFHLPPDLKCDLFGNTACISRNKNSLKWYDADKIHTFSIHTMGNLIQLLKKDYYSDDNSVSSQYSHHMVVCHTYGARNCGIDDTLLLLSRRDKSWIGLSWSLGWGSCRSHTGWFK